MGRGSVFRLQCAAAAAALVLGASVQADDDAPRPDAVSTGESSDASGVGAGTAFDGEAGQESRRAAVHPELDDDALVALALAEIESLSTLQAEFVQSSPSGLVSTGRFWLRRPGQMRFEYADPEGGEAAPLTIVATQGNVYVTDAALETTDFYPLKKTPLRFLLSKDLSLDDLEIVSVDRGEDYFSVAFAPRDGDAEGVVTAFFDGASDDLFQWAVEDMQGGVTVVELVNVETDVRLANRLFSAPQAGGAFINN